MFVHHAFGLLLTLALSSAGRPSRLQARLATPCDIPPELVDMCLRALADDKASLKSASLVCRRWWSCARRYMFDSVALTAVDRDGACLLPFLQHDRWPLRSLVKELHLRNQNQDVNLLTSLSVDDLARLISSCPGVEVLRFTHVRWIRARDQAMPLWPCFPRVRTLELTYRDSQAVPDLTSIFYWLPCVQEFIFNGGMLGRLESFDRFSPFARPLLLPPNLRLESCHLRSHEMDRYLLDYLQDTQTMQSLQSFSAVVTTVDEDFIAIGRIIQAASGTLRHVSLDLSSHKLSTRMYQRSHILTSARFSLGACTRLESLHLTMLLYMPRENAAQNSVHFDAAGRQVDEIVRTVASDAFTSLTFELVGSATRETELGTLHAYGWGELDAFLATHPTLRTVAWRWKAGWSDSLMTYLVKRMLPLTSMHRKLRIQPSVERPALRRSDLFHSNVTFPEPKSY